MLKRDFGCKITKIKAIARKEDRIAKQRRILKENGQVTKRGAILSITPLTTKNYL